MLDVAAVHGGDHHQRHDVVDDECGQEERRGPAPAPAGRTGRGRRARTRCRSTSRRPRRAAVGRPALTARKIRAGTIMPDQARGQRQRQARSFAQVAEVELAAGLEPDHEEEEGHEPAVDPAPQVEGDGPVLQPDLQLTGPEGVVRRGRRRSPRSSAMSAPASRNAALPDSVLRNRCRGVAMLLAHAVVPVNDRADSAPPLRAIHAHEDDPGLPGTRSTIRRSTNRRVPSSRSGQPPLNRRRR